MIRCEAIVRGALALLLLLVPLACTTSTTSQGGVGLGAPARDDRAPLEWARSEPWVIVVRRSCRTLSVYHYGDWVRTFDKVAFGRVPGVKVHEGDRRTPNGLYRIVGKRQHPRWTRFMLLDYPNLSDRDDHRRAMADGLAAAGPGGEIGIHGTDKERFNELGIDWTFGCVSLMNDDVAELYDMVPDGTLVLIED
ncbi:L,D-transpeptidase [Candidatus Binatia bacterium]|nr:L,D-transpeptidase [Candidatus Binatia bacterium]